MRNAVLCGVVVLAAVTMPASAAYATYPGAKGSITFEDENFDSTGGYTDLVRLTSKSKRLPSLLRCQYQTFEGRSGCASSGASFSRSGKRTAFAIDGRLAVAAADGSGRVLRPKLTEQDDDFAWTRGSQLVFTGLKAGVRNVYIVNSNGTGLRQITTKGGRGPAYSNRGLIAYSIGGTLHVVKPDGKKGRRIARGKTPTSPPRARPSSTSDAAGSTASPCAREANAGGSVAGAPAPCSHRAASGFSTWGRRTARTKTCSTR